MKLVGFNSYFQFLVSIAFSIAAAILPWAYVEYQVGTVKEPLAIPISFLDSSMLEVDGCSRGSVTRQDQILNGWLLFGQIGFICHISLWLAFIFKLFRLQRRGEAVAWLISIPVFISALFALVNPAVECLWTTLPPPLTFANQWHIGIVSVSFSVMSIIIGVWANAIVRKAER